jgi:hypothetical protein
MLVLSSLFLFDSVQYNSLGNDAAHSRGGSSYPERSLQTNQGVCFHGDFLKPSQVVIDDEPSHRVHWGLGKLTCVTL